MEIYAKYDNYGEMKKKALQKRNRLAYKILERGGMIRVDIDDINYEIIIKCYERKIYEQILKGFQSVV